MVNDLGSVSEVRGRIVAHRSSTSAVRTRRALSPLRLAVPRSAGTSSCVDRPGSAGEDEIQARCGRLAWS